MTADRIRRLAQTFLNGKAFVRAADLVVAGQADLALLIQLRLHSTGAYGYVIEDQPWVELNGLVFRDFLLKNPNYAPPLALPETQAETIESVGAAQSLSE